MTVTAETQFSAAFAAARQAAKGEPAWMSELREECQTSFLALGLPTIKDEEWRWTSLKRITGAAFDLAPAATLDAAQLAPFLIPGADDLRFVFVNGRFAPALSRFTSLPRGLVIKPLAEAIATEPAMHLALARYADTAQRFVALNTALFADGIYIRAGDGVVDEIPIHVLHVSTGAGVVAPRSLILAAENSQVSVVESYVGLGPATELRAGAGARLVVPVSEIVAKGGAKVRHVKLLREHDDTTHLGWNQFHLERDAEVSAHAVSLSGGLVRNDAHAVLSAEGANCTLNGLVLGNGSSHVDNHVLVDHVRPQGFSSQLYRSVVDDKSRSVFSGKVVVRPGANGTNAQQTNNNLLLSNDAKVDTKPQLEIYTDDVKCSHGATSGQLSPESVFFLRARGLNEAQARALLTWAFVREVIEQVKIEPARAALDKLISERFAGLLAS